MDSKDLKDIFRVINILSERNIPNILKDVILILEQNLLVYSVEASSFLKN